jgi:hypothetical protein
LGGSDQAGRRKSSRGGAAALKACCTGRVQAPAEADLEMAYEAKVAGPKPEQADDEEHAALFVAIQRGNPN